MKLKPTDIFRRNDKIIIDAGNRIGIELSCPNVEAAHYGVSLIRAYISQSNVLKKPIDIEKMVDFLAEETVPKEKTEQATT